MAMVREQQVEKGVRFPWGVHYGFVILLFGILGLAGTGGITRFAYTLILPAMRDGLQFQNSQMGLIGTVGFLGYMLMTIPGGALASRFGPRLLIALSLLVSGIALVFLGMANTLFQASVLMVAVQAASAPGNAAGFGFATAWFVGRSRATANGVVLGGPGVGIVAVGMLIPFVFSRYTVDGWRWAWYVSGAMTIALSVLCWTFLRNQPADKGLMAIGGLVPASSFATGANPLQKQGLASPDGPLPTVGEPDAPSPDPQPGDAAQGHASLAWWKVYRTPEIWRCCAIATVHGFVYIIYGTFFATFALDEVGLSHVQTGNLWSLVGVLSIFSGLVGGLLSDRLGRPWAFTALYLGQLATNLLVAFSHTPIALYMSIPLYGLTVMGFPAIFGATCGELLGPRLAPAGVGLIIFFFSLGQALGPYFAGALYDQTGSFTSPFLAACGALGFGLIATWFRASPALPSLGGIQHEA